MNEAIITWGDWDSVGGSEGEEQRYIETVRVGGHEYTADCGDLIRDDGIRFANCGRGERRGNEYGPIAVFALDGVLISETREVDAEQDCLRAIWAETTK